MAAENPRYYDATTMHMYASVQGAIFNTASVKALFSSRAQMEHMVEEYNASPFKGVPLVVSEYGIDYNQESTPWGKEGKATRSASKHEN